MENGIDNMINKLNEEKMNYKKQIENYKDNNLKTFDFLKNLYSRYINNFEDDKNKQNENNENSNEIVNHDNNINHNDIMLTNHINKFAIDNKMPKFNSNVDEILEHYNEEQKELKLKYDPFKSQKKESKNEYRNYDVSDSYRAIKKKFVCTETLEGHEEKIVCLIQLSSGKLASGSYDNTIRIWDLDNETEDKVINENGRVFALLEYEKDKILVVTSDNVINLWDVRGKGDLPLFSFL